MTQHKTQQLFQLPNYYSTQHITVVLSPPSSASRAGAEIHTQANAVEELATAQARLIHLRDGEVVLFKITRSKKWQARFRVTTGKWVRFTTKRTSIEEATRIACDKYDEARYRERLGFAMFVKRFDEMARYCVEEMRRDLDAGVGLKV